jgi:NAD(P)-dependent dehydrogenase (short-subunit alcohol dehydrogenase family)
MAKVSLITGSAARLGREIALHLANGGWDLALHYRNSSKDISDFETELKSRFPNQHFFAFQTDLGAKDQTENLIKLVIDRFNQLDLLINNASVFEPSTLKQTSTNADKFCISFYSNA